MKVSLGKYPKGPSKRRIDVKIDNFDTWGLDHTLALIILPALIQLKHTKHGVPQHFVNDEVEDYHDQIVFDFMKDDKDEVFQKGCDSWDEVFDKMIWSFQQLTVDEDYDSKYHHGKMETEWKKTEPMLNPATGKMEEMYEMIDKNPDEHWYDYVGHTLHNERIQEGLELFGKHFRDLWD